MQGPLSLAIFDCAGKSRGDDRPCMLGLGIDLKRTEEINLVDGVASCCPRVGLDAEEREEVLSRVRRARFLSRFFFLSAR